MNEIYQIQDSTDKAFGRQLMIGGIAYVMWLWYTDDTASDEDREPDAYQLTLSPIKLNGLSYTNGNACQMDAGGYVVQGVSQWRLDNQFDGDARKLYEAFLVKVNQFITENSGDEPVTDPSGDAYPENGTLTEQIYWLLKQGDEVVNGQVVLKS